MNIVIIEQGKDTYTAISERSGYPLGTTIRKVARKQEIERIALERFNSQVHILKQDGADIPNVYKTIKHTITWVSACDIYAFANNNFAAKSVNSKPKLYEIQKNTNGGFTLIKHNAELLDEDEAKIKLFETAVNGDK